MDLATIEPALLAAVSTCAGLPAAACVFENAPRPIAQAVALLSWVSRAGVGIDEASWAYEAAEDPLD